MQGQTNISEMSIFDIIGEVIERESKMRALYKRIIEDVGQDVQPVMVHLCARHEENIALLERLIQEIKELRELTAAIAD